MAVVGDHYTDTDGEWEVTSTRAGVVTGAVLKVPSAAFEAKRGIPPLPPSADRTRLDAILATPKATRTLADAQDALDVLLRRLAPSVP